MYRRQFSLQRHAREPYPPAALHAVQLSCSFVFTLPPNSPGPRAACSKKNKWLPKLKAWIDEQRPGERMIPYSAGMEAKLFAMSEDEKMVR
jgi:hypothetical protein